MWNKRSIYENIYQRNYDNNVLFNNEMLLLIK